MSETVTEQGSLQVQGRTRRFLVVRPALPRPVGRLLLALHGSGSSGAGFRRLTRGGLERWPQVGGGVTVYPDSWERSLWNDARRSTPSKARAAGVDDVAFLRALQQELSPTAGTYAVGYSNGGQMVIRALLEEPPLLTAAALLSASVAVPDNLLDGGATAAVPVLVTHGTKDPLVPYGGGTASLFGFRPRGQVRSAEDSAAFWAARNGITTTPEVTVLPAAAGDRTLTRRWAYERPGHAPVHFYATEGGGHVVPGPGLRNPRLMGRSARNFDLPSTVLDFFEQAGAAGGAHGGAGDQRPA